ncbi:MAG TPA: hypothetical protein VIH35_08655, partial [Kiritimatiellia bacterium]
KSATADDRTRLTADSFPLIITNAGAYRLDENVRITNAGAHGITIMASDVAIDLRGKKLTGPGEGAGSCIYQPAGFERLVVSNGVITGWRSDPATLPDNGHAILARGRHNHLSELYFSSNSVGAELTDFSVISNSNIEAHETGIVAGPRSRVFFCTAFEIGGDAYVLGADTEAFLCTAYSAGLGFRVAGSNVRIVSSTAYSCAGPGILAAAPSSVLGCAAYSNEIGIQAVAQVRILDAGVNDNRVAGIDAASNCVIQGAASTFNVGDGIRVGADCEVVKSMGNDNGGAGIRMTGGRNLVEGSQAQRNTWGIWAEGSGNTIVGNQCGGNKAMNFRVEGTNHTVGPILDKQGAATNTNDDANFEL